VKVIKNAEVVDIVGGDRVTGIKVKDLTTQQITELPMDGIFVAIGHLPDCDLFKTQVQTDDQGYIISRRHGAFSKQEDDGTIVQHRFHTMTSVEGVFVAGDVHDFHYRQAITAAGYGCEAALEVERWLTDH
jgi:thioredoxin reductase (NADPH)